MPVEPHLSLMDFKIVASGDLFLILLIDNLFLPDARALLSRCHLLFLVLMHVLHSDWAPDFFPRCSQNSDTRLTSPHVRQAAVPI